MIVLLIITIYIPVYTTSPFTDFILVLSYTFEYYFVLNFDSPRLTNLKAIVCQAFPKTCHENYHKSFVDASLDGSSEPPSKDHIHMARNAQE